ncbi:MAG: polyhydroxyalkanoic acid system family protein [Polyangiaceae bacterium]|nr:polyhydroxyalkanoic acid system family protein [Polyangiaceae bacterium]
MKHSIRHDLTSELAKTATERAFESYRQKLPEYDPRATWTSPTEAKVTFKVKGVGLDGAVRLRQGEVELELDVPFVFKIFQKRAMEIIEREVREWLEKAKSGQL